MQLSRTSYAFANAEHFLVNVNFTIIITNYITINFKVYTFCASINTLAVYACKLWKRKFLNQSQKHIYTP